MVSVKNRKVFLISIFVLFALLYWAIFFQLLLWQLLRAFTGLVLWLIIIGFVVLYLVIAVTAIYLARKYNYWMAPYSGDYDQKDEFRVQYHVDQQRQQKTLHYDQSQQQQQKLHLAMVSVNGSQQSTTNTCDVFVDNRILQDAQTQTETGSSSPNVYRTSLIIPRTPNSDTSNGSAWFYPTLADYYREKTHKLKDRMSKTQLELANVEIKEQGIRRSISTPQKAAYEVDCPIHDTKMFLLSQQQLCSSFDVK